MGKIGIIVKREFNERVRKKSFLISTILTPLLFAGLIGGMFAMVSIKTSKTKVVEVIDNSGFIADKLKSNALLRYLPTERTLEQINAEHGTTWGVLVIGSDVMSNPNNVQLYTYSSSTMDTEMAISRAVSDIIENEKLKGYDIENLAQILSEVRTRVSPKAYKVDDSGAEKESSSGLAMALAYLFGILMYMFVLLYGAQVMNGVIEEKNSKVLEVIVSSVKPFQLMMGKIIGIALVAVTQFLIWIVGIGVMSSAMILLMIPADILAAAQGVAQGMTPEMMQAMDLMAENSQVVTALANMMDFSYLGSILVMFLIYFVGGYLLYAALFAAVGSAVSNVQDSQQFQLIVTMPLILGLIGMINAMQDPGGSLAFWLSIIPFTSPMVMVARVPYGVPGWELALSIGLLIATFVMMVWLAGKIYRVGIFMYGKKPTFREIAKWISYKS